MNRIGTFPQQRIIPTINMHILKVPGVSGIAYLQLNHYLFIFLYLNLIWLGGNE